MTRFFIIAVFWPNLVKYFRTIFNAIFRNIFLWLPLFVWKSWIYWILILILWLILSFSSFTTVISEPNFGYVKFCFFQLINFIFFFFLHCYRWANFCLTFPKHSLICIPNILLSYWDFFVKILDIYIYILNFASLRLLILSFFPIETVSKTYFYLKQPFSAIKKW